MDNKNQCCSCCRQKLFPVLAAVLTIFLAVLVVSTAVGIQNKIKEGRYIGQDAISRNTITVSGTGKVYAKPDLALATFSITTEAKTVAQAMSENTEKMNAVIKFMKEQGVEDKDLKTTDFNIYPRYEYVKASIEIWPYPEGKRVLVGYEVIQSLEVKIRDMAKIGTIIQGATDEGANQVGNLQFTIDKQEEFKKQARAEAVKEAKEKARDLAAQLGVNLSKIINFNESGVSPFFDYYDFAQKEAVGLGGGSAPAPEIQTGENKIEITVQITYEIN